jgi:hypothetical protein
MRLNKTQKIVFILFAWLALSGRSCTETTETTGVDSVQKVSDTAGNFEGVLEDNDQFGSAVANIGDLEVDGVIDLAVGAPLDDDGGTDRGAVWILFMNADGTVQFAQKISNTEGGFSGILEDNDQFGAAIANIGDLNNDLLPEIAVGAIGDDDGGVDRGAVWALLMNADSTVRFEQKISATNGNFNGGLDDDDHFGSSVTGLGDINGDGIFDIAAGAEQDDDGGSNRGAVWLMFMERDGEIISESKISSVSGNFPGTLTDGTQFGSALANPGDLDLDGTIDIVTGAKLDDDGGADRGALWTLFMQQSKTDRKITIFDDKQ